MTAEPKKNPHILVIEDNPGDFVLIREYLDDSLISTEIHHATTFVEAEHELHSGIQFDVILLDLTLPDLTGDSLVSSIVELAGSIPVIVLTGYQNQEYSLRTLSLGISDYLVKDEINPVLLSKSIFYSIERNRINRSLKSSEKQYRELFDLSPQPMWVYDLDTLRFLDVNRAAIRHYGYSREEFLEMTLLDIRPEEDMKDLEDAVELARNKEELYFEGTFRHKKKSGEIIIVNIKSNIIDFNGIKSEMVLAEDVTDRKKKEVEINESIKEKEVLLMEIHHRVKNNLAVVSGMMQLQAFEEDDDNFRKKLLDSVSRIKTMAIIHEILYQNRSFSRVKLDENLRKLVSSLLETFQLDFNLEVKFNLEPVELNINQAIPCSLIVNEVVTNIMKHAYDEGQKGLLNLNLHRDNDQVFLTIQDDGKGLPVDFSSNQQAGSLGLKLIETLASQLKADYKYNSPGTGTVFTLEFEKGIQKGIGNAFFNV